MELKINKTRDLMLSMDIIGGVAMYAVDRYHSDVHMTRLSLTESKRKATRIYKRYERKMRKYGKTR